MSNSRVLLVSTTYGCGNLLAKFLEQTSVLSLLIIPFARPNAEDHDAYVDQLRASLNLTNVQITGINTSMSKQDMHEAVKRADGIFICGGNTFCLLHRLYEFDLIPLIRDQVQHGKPYVGSSAGSNVAGPDVRTTNDMPIVHPPSFDSLALVPYNINPHYTNFKPPNYAGEGRDDRLVEFIQYSHRPVVALGEGSAIQVLNGIHEIVAQSNEIVVKIFGYDQSVKTKVAVQQVPVGENILPLVQRYLQN